MKVSPAANAHQPPIARMCHATRTSPTHRPARTHSAESSIWLRCALTTSHPPSTIHHPNLCRAARSSPALHPAHIFAPTRPRRTTARCQFMLECACQLPPSATGRMPHLSTRSRDTERSPLVPQVSDEADFLTMLLDANVKALCNQPSARQ